MPECELVGGPLDGEILDIKDDCQQVLWPVRHEGIYVYIREDEEKFVYQGEAAPE